MRIPALTLALLASATFLAGCSDGGQEPATDFDDIGLDATVDTGIIRGVVIDAAITPIADATVTATGPDDATATGASNADGLFGFDGLAPGTWFVQASKAGFVTTQQSVDVVADEDEPDIVKLLLERDPALTPYIAELVFEGFLECNVSIVVVRFAACSTVSNVTNDNFLVRYTLDQPPRWIQSEMIWESTQPLGDELQISITDFSTPLQERVNASAGPSPQYITVNETQALALRYGINNTVVIRVFNDAVDETDVWPDSQIQEAWGSTVYPVYNGTPAAGVVQTVFDTVGLPNPLQECIMYPALFNACLGMGGVGATIEQAFTVYTHVFYHTDPLPGWRFSEDGGHPPPA